MKNIMLQSPLKTPRSRRLVKPSVAVALQLKVGPVTMVCTTSRLNKLRKVKQAMTWPRKWILTGFWVIFKAH